MRKQNKIMFLEAKMSENVNQNDLEHFFENRSKCISAACRLFHHLLGMNITEFREELGDILCLEPSSIQNYDRKDRRWPDSGERLKSVLSGIDEIAQKRYENNQIPFYDAFLAVRFSPIFKSEVMEYKNQILDLCNPEYVSRYWVTGICTGKFDKLMERVDEDYIDIFRYFKEQIKIFAGINEKLLSPEEYDLVSKFINKFT